MNKFALTLHPLLPPWTMVIIILIFVFFLWKELERHQKFLGARIVALFIIFLTVLGLLYRPHTTKQQSAADHLLLTPGYKRSTVDSLLGRNPELKIIRTIEVEAYGTDDLVESPSEIAALHYSVQYIIGQGLPRYVLESLDTPHFQFIPGNVITGIQHLAPHEPYEANQRGVIRGVFRNTGTTTLILAGPSGAEDSVSFRTDGLLPFELEFYPKHAGNFVYTLAVRKGIQLVRERLPVVVGASRKLRILFLQKFPTAETRYLKNYLSEKGHAVVVRYQTSQSNFRFEYSNVPAVQINRLTPARMNSFDLILIDTSSLKELGDDEASSLQKAVQEGLGLILLLDELPRKGSRAYRFLPVNGTPIATDTVHLPLSGLEYHTFPIIPVALAPDPSLKAILQHSNKILSGYRYAGAGKVGFQLLKETYRRSLEGNIEDYAAVWAPLISKTARSSKTQFQIGLVTPFPYYENEPINIDVIAGEQKPTLLADSIGVPLTEDVTVDDYWLGKIWAGKRGWHSLFIPEDSTQLSYYASGNEEWRSLRMSQQAQENRLASSVHSNFKRLTYDEEVEVSPLYFFLLFLLAAGFLWLAPKI
jgi:hypothetical protein